MKYLKRFLIVFILYLLAGYTCKRIDIKSTIQDKSGVEISPYFNINYYDIKHTAGAIDSDYTLNFQVKISPEDLTNISKQIENSKFFNLANQSHLDRNVNDDIKRYNTQGHDLKGHWRLTKVGYEFNTAFHEWAERTTIKVDKYKRTINVTLTHL